MGKKCISLNFIRIAVNRPSFMLWRITCNPQNKPAARWVPIPQEGWQGRGRAKSPLWVRLVGDQWASRPQLFSTSLSSPGPNTGDTPRAGSHVVSKGRWAPLCQVSALFLQGTCLMTECVPNPHLCFPFLSSPVFCWSKTNPDRSILSLLKLAVDLLIYFLKVNFSLKSNSVGFRIIS